MPEELAAGTLPRVPILATKLHIPQRGPSLVPRQRLETRLAEGMARPLILISAPAGFGKTTLVAEWIRQVDNRTSGGVPAAWLSLDDDDNDPARFLAYVISALDTLRPGLGGAALGLLESPQPPPWKTVSTVLLNSLESLPGDFVLVLDDYHVLTAPPIHATLAYLLDHQPVHMHHG